MFWNPKKSASSPAHTTRAYLSFSNMKQTGFYSMLDGIQVLCRVTFQLLLFRYPFIHLLVGGEGHCKSKVPGPRIQYNDPCPGLQPRLSPVSSTLFIISLCSPLWNKKRPSLKEKQHSCAFDHPPPLTLFPPEKNNHPTLTIQKVCIH